MKEPSGGLGEASGGDIGIYLPSIKYNIGIFIVSLYFDKVNCISTPC